MFETEMIQYNQTIKKHSTIIHKDKIQINNLKIVNNNHDLSVGSLTIDTNKNNTAYINNINVVTSYSDGMKIPSMRLQVEKDNVFLPETNLFMPNSKLTIKGTLTNYTNKDIAYSIYGSGYVNSSDIKSLKIKSNKYPIKFNVSGNKLLQNILTQILFEKTDILDEPAILNIAAKLSGDRNPEKINLKLDDLSLIGFSGKFSDDLKSNLKGQKKLVANGVIENLKEPFFKNIRITLPQILNLQFIDTVAQLKGDVFLNGEYLKPEIIGQVLIQNMFNQPTQLSISNCTVDFNKNIAVINSPLIKIADSSMGINANIYTDFSKSILVKNLNIKSKFLNTDTILMYKDLPLMKLCPVEVQEGKFYSERVQAFVYGTPINLTAFTGDFKLNNDKI